MEWEADPNALGFYRKMGGRHLRTEVTEWGREGSVTGITLARAERRPERSSRRLFPPAR